MGKRWCSKCRIAVNSENAYRTGGRCKNCAKESLEKWAEENPEKRRMRTKTWLRKVGKAKQRELNRGSWLKREYGMTQADYEKMLAQQNSECACCGRKNVFRLVIDHNHKTKHVRALVCDLCNTILGMLEKHPEKVKRAAKYLRKYDHPTSAMPPLWISVGDAKEKPDSVC